MSPYGRRESSKIVISSATNKEREISGGLKNALERGETLQKAKQSFLNAGYKPSEINAAVQKIPSKTPEVKKPLTPSPQAKAQPPQSATPTQITTAPTQNIPGQKKSLSKTFIIILISSAALVLVVAALLGLFWDKIF